MSKISYPQLIKNIANVYRNATGSSEPVAIGELASKLEEAMSNKNSITQKPMSVTNGAEVILPVVAEPLIVETSNSITIETTVNLESEE